MSLPNELHPLQLGAGSAAAYEIEQSLRFDQSYLLRTPSSAGNRRTYTFSVWLKRMNTGRDGFFGAWSTTTSRDAFRFDSGTDELRIFLNETTNGNIYSNAKYRDYSGWYHVVAAVDTTQATASDRVKVWINGESVSFRSASYPAQNSESYFNNTVKHYIGTTNLQNDQEWQGYLAEFHHVDGTALDHEDFGEFDNNGVWRPKRYTGSYGTNGFYLTFDPSATNGIGHDHSGNGNNFTPTNFTTSGTGTDVMSDTPTNNFATLNPLIGYQAGGLLAPTYSDGNLTVAPQVNSGNNSRVASATLARDPGNGGVWRWEMVVNNNSNASYGIMALNENTGQGSFGPTWGATGLGGNLFTSNGASANLQEQHSTISAGDVITIVVSFDDNEIGWYINGTRTGFYNGCNFSNYDQLVPFFKESTRTQTPCTFDVNFGQKAFQYTTSGDAWGDLSTLPAPTVKDGSKHFNTVLWTGDGTTSKTVGNLSFQPEWIWIKDRSAGYRHNVWDIVRGFGNYLQPSYTDAEVSMGTSEGTSFFLGPTSSGFTVGQPTSGPFSGNLSTNENNTTFVGWSWLAGGSGSSNTDGSITSTVSANPTAGFSIVSYTGTGTGSDTVGHGLGVAPKIVILKDRDNAENWPFYHTLVDGSLDYMHLNLTDANVNSAWNVPTSTVFSASGIAGSGDDCIAYCFAEVEGYSKFGSYTGNGSSDGPFVYTGFRPRFLLYKRTDSAQPWYIIDSARDTYNVSYKLLSPNSSAAEDTGSSPLVDLLSNGFKPRNTYATLNASGGTYIYMALAENPFGGSGVSPATAR